MLDIAEPSCNGLPDLCRKIRLVGSSIGPKQSLVFGQQPLNAVSGSNQTFEIFGEVLSDSFHENPAALIPKTKNELKPRNKLSKTQSSQPLIDYPPFLDSPAIKMRQSTSLRASGAVFPGQQTLKERQGASLSEIARAKLSKIKESEDSYKKLETLASSVREPNEETMNPLSSFRTTWDPKSLQTHQTQFMSLASISMPMTRDNSPKHPRFQPSSTQHQFSALTPKTRFANSPSSGPEIHHDEYNLGGKNFTLKSKMSKFDRQSQANSTFGSDDLEILKDQASAFKRRIEVMECEYASVLRSVEGLHTRNFYLQQQRDRITASQHLASECKHPVSNIPVVNLSSASKYLQTYNKNSTISHLDSASENGHDPASLVLMEWAYLSYAHRLTSSDDPEIDQLLSRISQLRKAA